MITLKENDVYFFNYSEDFKKTQQGDLRHCFDGILEVVKTTRTDLSDEFILRDTFWSGNESRFFTLEDALKKGELKFALNYDDYISASEYDYNYYDDSDMIRLGIHHGYRTKIYRKKDSERSIEKMKEVILIKIKESENKIISEERNILSLNDNFKKLLSGDTSIYF